MSSVVPFPLSPSRMSLASCPLALANRNNNVKPDAPTASFLTLGSEAHAVFEEINNHTGALDDDFLDMAIGKHVVHSDPVLVRRWGKKYITHFPVNEVAGTELKLALNADLVPCDFDDEEVAFRCVIDALIPDPDNPHRVKIVDNKTGFMIYKPDTEQLDFYAWIVNRCFPEFFEAEVGIYFARWGRLKYNDFVYTNFADIERAILAKARAIWEMDLSNPQPMAGETCTICNNPVSCPLADRKVERITTDEEAEEMARVFLAKKRQVEVLRKKLKDWSDARGPIQTNPTTAIGFKEASRRTVDVKEVVKYLKEYPQLINALSASVTEVLKVLPDFPVEVSYHTSFKTWSTGPKKAR
jgi:hypothetical protein